MVSLDEIQELLCTFVGLLGNICPLISLLFFRLKDPLMHLSANIRVMFGLGGFLSYNPWLCSVITVISEVLILLQSGGRG